MGKTIYNTFLIIIMNILNLNFDQSYLVDTLCFGGRGLGQAPVDVTKIFCTSYDRVSPFVITLLMAFFEACVCLVMKPLFLSNLCVE